MKLRLIASKIAGGNPENGRVEHDWYATDPRAVEMLFEKHNFNRNIKNKRIMMSFLEPCVGKGHIADEVLSRLEDCNIQCKRADFVDLIDRGYPDTVVADYLKWKPESRYDLIITNPPYSLASEFIEKSMKLLTARGQMAMFLKLQFLEGQKRKELFEKYPPKYIYVFRNRMAVWNRGNEVDPSTGKKWATTMCHAWFIWENGSETEPVVRWL